MAYDRLASRRSDRAPYVIIKGLDGRDLYLYNRPDGTIEVEIPFRLANDADVVIQRTDLLEALATLGAVSEPAQNEVHAEHGPEMIAQSHGRFDQ